MIYHRRRGWDLPGLKATPETVAFDRRSLIKASVAAGAVVASQGFSLRAAAAASDYPAKRNDTYKVTRAITPEDVNVHYNNFYEFSPSRKDIYDLARNLKTHPWTIEFDGLVEKPRKVDVDTLIKAIGLEERLYRHRCVETWAMVVPWTGFPLRALIDYAKPLSAAKFIQFETFRDPRVAPGQRQFLPWPYIEGVTMAEAANDVSFMVTGAYGKPLDNSFGAPIRLHLPWKYGFKSAKSIVKISFVDKQPKTFWEGLARDEYGFWANVNPAVPHPRWSQATEEILGTNQRVPTQLFNGYGEMVAGLYAGNTDPRLYM